MRNKEKGYKPAWEAGTSKDFLETMDRHVGTVGWYGELASVGAGGVGVGGVGVGGKADRGALHSATIVEEVDRNNFSDN